MIAVVLLIVGRVTGQYETLPDDMSEIHLNGYTDYLLNWDGYDYFQQGRDWPGICAIGTSQSPIDINEYPEDPSLFQVVTPSNSTLRPVTFETELSDVYLQNNQYFPLYRTFRGNFWVVTNGIVNQQVLAQMMFHAPGETTVNGIRYPMGIQLTYSRVSAGGFMLGGSQVYILVREGQSNPGLAQVIAQQPLDVKYFLPPSLVLDDYYFYIGSFNLPVRGCPEGVGWYVSNYVIEGSSEQIAYFQDRFVNDHSFSGGLGNVRALQPQNGRTIYHFVRERGGEAGR